MKKRLYARYNGPEGYTHDVVKFKHAEMEGELVRGELYVVENVRAGSAFTAITLQGVSSKYKELNSVAFDFAITRDGHLVRHNIYNDKEFNPYLSNEK